MSFIFLLLSWFHFGWLLSAAKHTNKMHVVIVRTSD